MISFWFFGGKDFVICVELTTFAQQFKLYIKNMADYNDVELVDEQGSMGFDYRKLWSVNVLNWPWVVLSAFLCVAAAYIYIRYQRPVYEVNTKIIIKDTDEGRNLLASRKSLYFDDFGTSGFETELEVLGSVSIATRAVKAKKFYVTYSGKGMLTNNEFYKDSPIMVDLEEDKLDDLPCPITVLMKPEDTNVHVSISVSPEFGGPQLERTVTTFPATLQTRFGKIVMARNPGVEFVEKELTAVVYPPVMMGRIYSSKLGLSPSSKNNTSVAVLSLLDTHVERATDYLIQLVESYNEDANDDKNEVARKTEEFINSRLELIKGDLDVTEKQLERFKRSNELVNLASDATTARSQSVNYQQKLVELQTELALVRSLCDYINNPRNCLDLIPAIDVTNLSVSQMISEYNNKVLLRNRLLRSAPESSPRIEQLTESLQDMWTGIGRHLAKAYKDVETRKRAMDKQVAMFTGKIEQTPGQERVLNNIGRQQEIQAGLYLMLLQKREENMISMASTAAKARVIDEPQFLGKVAPKSRIIMLFALLFGIILPIAIFYLKEMLRYTIEGREDLQKMTKIPVMADIPLSEMLEETKQRAVVVRENSNDIMEESFRNLRTNLRFVMRPDQKVICTTSCAPGEGKTFVSTNLAMSLALLGKRVLIIGLDIRKPRLVKLFGLPSDAHGITTYLAGGSPDFKLLESQIIRGVINPNLDVLPAGVIPPNPGELITRDLLDKGIEHLKTIYDYILLDTPPIGMVSDTYELARIVDVTFIVVRAEFTAKVDIEQINRVKEDNRLPNVNIVLNGVDLNKRKYGFYYGYGKYSQYHKYGTYYGRYGHYGNYGHYGENSKEHIEK